MKSDKKLGSRRKSGWYTEHPWRSLFRKIPDYPARPRTKKNKLLRPIHRA